MFDDYFRFAEFFDGSGSEFEGEGRARSPKFLK